DPAMELAVEDDAGRNPRPDAEIDEVVGAAKAGVVMEADGSGADVVLDDAWHAEARREPAAEREVLPTEIDGEGHVAARRVDPTGDAEADRAHVCQGRARLADGVADDARDLGDRFVRLRGGRRDGPPSEHCVVRS